MDVAKLQVDGHMDGWDRLGSPGGATYKLVPKKSWVLHILKSILKEVVFNTTCHMLWKTSRAGCDCDSKKDHFWMRGTYHLDQIIPNSFHRHQTNMILCTQSFPLFMWDSAVGKGGGGGGGWVGWRWVIQERHIDPSKPGGLQRVCHHLQTASSAPWPGLA